MTLDNSGLPVRDTSINMETKMSHTGESASLGNLPPASKSQHPLRRLKSSIHDLQERHRDRHRPTGFVFVFADRVDYLDPLRWDAVTGDGSIFLSRAVLRVIDVDELPE